MFTKKENEEHVLWLLRWTARMLSVVVVLILTFYFLGEQNSLSALSLREYIGLLFFPLGLIAGLIVAWKNELLGAMIAVGSVVGFYTLYVLLLGGSLPGSAVVVLFALPAFLFLIDSLLSRYWHTTPSGRFARNL